MSSSYHHRLSRARRRRSRLQWERVHPQKARRTIRITYGVEDVVEGRTMSGTRGVQPVAMALQPDFVSTLGLTRRFMAFGFVVSSNRAR
jgi:hypothetical protein